MADKDGTRRTVDMPLDAWGKVLDALHIADEWSMDHAHAASNHDGTAHYAQLSGEYAAVRRIIMAQLVTSPESDDARYRLT